METQQALVVTDAPGRLEKLNERLRQGWRVVTVAPMGGGGQTDGFAALVVIERAGQAAEAVLEQIVEEVEEALEENGAPAGVVPDEDVARRLSG